MKDARPPATHGFARRMRRALLALHRLLLLLLPPGFRADFGEELAASVRARVASRDCVVDVAILGALELLDLLRTAGREWGAASVVWAQRLINGAGTDLRVATRSLVKAPATSAIAIATLAVGIGGATAIYSVVEGVLLRALPYPEPDRIVSVSLGVRPQSGRTEGSFSDRGYWFFARSNEAFESFGAYEGGDIQLPLTGVGPATRVHVAGMTRSAFQVVGVPPELGRLPSSREDGPGGQATVALISHRLWVDRFRSDPAIVGSDIVLAEIAFEIIGVMPAGYDFPIPETDVWLPRRLDPASDNVGSHHLAVVARLKPGAAIDDAVADAERLVSRFGEVGYEPEWFEGIFNGRVIVRPLKEWIVGGAREPLWVAFGTVAILLIIACANVATLLVVRAQSTTRARTIRMALGAGRGRLIRYAAMEGLVLSLAGGLAGTGLAVMGTRALVAAGPPIIPRLDQVGIDGSVLLLTLAISVSVGFGFGLLPARRSAAPESLARLRTGGGATSTRRERRRATDQLVVGQVALALVLLTSSGLMVRSLEELSSIDPGFDARDVLTFRVTPASSRYRSGEATARFYQQLTDRFEELPGVVSAAGITDLPMTSGESVLATRIEDHPTLAGEFPPTFHVRRVTPGYFATMRIPVLAGREFTSVDHENRLGTVLVSESIQRRFWPGRNALGKRLSTAGAPGRVVGVVGDVHDSGLDVQPEPIVYRPLLDSVGGGANAMSIVVRADGDRAMLIAEARGAMSDLDPDVPITDVRSMEDLVAESFSRTSFTMVLLLLAAVVALGLAALGIYAVLSHLAAQRTGEIGLRIALGATSADVRSMILRRGMWLAGLGCGAGLVGSLLVGPLLDSFLFRVDPLDTTTLVGVILTFLTAAAIASLIPASRAAAMRPADALRAE
jgi:predicted permease